MKKSNEKPQLIFVALPLKMVDIFKNFCFQVLDATDVLDAICEHHGPII